MATLVRTLRDMRAHNARKVTWHENGEVESVELFSPLQEKAATAPETSASVPAQGAGATTPKPEVDLIRDVIMASAPPIVLTAEDFPPEVVEGQPFAEFTEPHTEAGE